MATLVDLDIDQNADYQSVTFDWLDVNGSPMNLSGATATLTIRPRLDPTSTAILTITETSGITLGGTLGTISWVFTNAQTNTLTAGEYAYTLRIVTADSKAAQLLSGAVFVRGSAV